MQKATQNHGDPETLDTTIPVRMAMPNGASVADWLGTAGTAASIAGADCLRLRSASCVSKAEIQAAQRKLEQAWSELEEIRHWGGRHGE